MNQHISVFAETPHRSASVSRRPGRDEAGILATRRAKALAGPRALTFALLPLCLSLLGGCATVVDILNDMPYSNTALEQSSFICVFGEPQSTLKTQGWSSLLPVVLRRFLLPGLSGQVGASPHSEHTRPEGLSPPKTRPKLAAAATRDMGDPTRNIM